MRMILSFVISVMLSPLFLNANPSSCREALGVDTKYLKNDFYSTEVYLLIDESTYFNNKAKEDVFKKITPFIKDNTRINLFSFSEYSRTKANKNLGSFYIFSALTNNEEDDISRSKVKDLKECLSQSKIYAATEILKAINLNTRKQNESIDKSEILKNLKVYTKNNLRFSKAKRKVAIIMSDMIENSDYTTFYLNGKLKSLDIDKELKVVEKHRLLSAFNGAEVYIYGLGLVEINSDKSDARNAFVMDNLINFWDEYIIQSGGKPFGLDSPNMAFDIQY